MDIISAVREAIASGNPEIREKSWGEGNGRKKKKKGILVIKSDNVPEGKIYPYMMTAYAILATDWEVVENDAKIPND